MSTRGALALAALLYGCVPFATGCVAKAAEDLTVMADDDLLDGAGLDDSGAWQSAPWTRARWIPYSGGSQVTVHHGLGRIPTSIEVYISGDRDDSKADRTRNAYAAAGNIATITNATDELVSVKNISAGDFYIRLVLR